MKDDSTSIWDARGGFMLPVRSKIGYEKKMYFDRLFLSFQRNGWTKEVQSNLSIVRDCVRKNRNGEVPSSSVLRMI